MNVSTSTIDELPEWMNTEVFAKWLDIPPATPKQWRWQGKGPRYVKVGRHIRYRRADVEEWLAGGPDDVEDLPPTKRLAVASTQSTRKAGRLKATTR
jgi:hypothetical protein